MKEKEFDKVLFLSVILLSLFGLIMIYSSSNVWALYKFGDAFKFIKNQGLFFIAGIIIMFFLSRVNYRLYYKHSNKILLVCFILLILVLIPGVGIVRNGSRSWFGIGSFGVQPSELTKIALIIFFSKYFVNNDKHIRDIKKGTLPILLVATSVFGLIMLQPDFGTGMVIMISVISLVFISGVSYKFFINLGIVGLLGIAGLVISAPYRLSRILSFLNPWKDPLGSGFQIIQSLYALGPGGILGFGFGESRQKHFYLPEPQTDFIFSIITEEFGFVGCLFVCIMFLTILIRGVFISLKSKDLFAKYLAFGLTFQIIFQAVLNLMVVTGLIPVTGVTLPFLSYGGSSLLISFASIGILLNISKYTQNV